MNFDRLGEPKGKGRSAGDRAAHDADRGQELDPVGGDPGGGGRDADQRRDGLVSEEVGPNLLSRQAGSVGPQDPARSA